MSAGDKLYEGVISEMVEERDRLEEKSLRRGFEQTSFGTTLPCIAFYGL